MPPHPTRIILHKEIRNKPDLKFPIVFYGRYEVDGLTPNQIDEMLENGWFRNDNHVHTTIGRYVENEWKPCLMLRLPLTNFKWKKRLKRLKRKNGELFKVNVRPFEPRLEIDKLWKKYKSAVHNWQKVPNLSSHLFKGNPPSSFNTFEVSIYQNDKLVAFSVFDKGARSIASLEAAYDPVFGKHSLGLFTMLVEIETGIDWGLDYYYPGFLPRDTPMFDYKLRPGSLEFLQTRTGKWISLDQKSPSDWLLDEVVRELRSIQLNTFHEAYKSSMRASYSTSVPYEETASSAYNFFLLIEQEGKPILKIVYDILKSRYFVFKPILERYSPNSNAISVAESDELAFAANAQVEIVRWINEYLTENELHV